MTVTFILPRSFDPAEFLPARFIVRADEARWLMSTILHKMASRDTDLWGCVRLDSRILRRVMGHHAADVARALENGGAIETASYRAGVRCKGYRIAHRFLGDHCVRVLAVEPGLLERLAQERQRQDAKESQTRWQPIHYALDAEQRRLSIDVVEADQILTALPTHTRLCQDVLVSHLGASEYRFSVGCTGRCFNGISGLKRELRRALRIDAEHVGCVDIACAQPALLALEMAWNIPAIGLKGPATYKHWRPASPPSPVPLPSDSTSPPTPDSFPSLVFSGLFYDSLMKATGLERDRVKLGFLRDVLAKRGRYPSTVEQAFRQTFPSVYDYIRAVNRNDHAELIRRLQRRESWLVIENVAPRLIGRVPCLTLHDAIYSTVQSLPAVEEAFNEVFDEIGCRLALKREAT